jgi:hypothetical protein
MIVSDNSYPKYWLRGGDDAAQLLYCVAAPNASPTYWYSSRARLNSPVGVRHWQSTDYTSEACIHNTSRLRSIDAATAAKWLLANGHKGLPNASV